MKTKIIGLVEEKDSPIASYKLQFARQLITEHMLKTGWYVYVDPTIPGETYQPDLFCFRKNVRPYFINVQVRNKNKVPASQGISLINYQLSSVIKEITSYSVFTVFIDEMCGDVHGVNCTSKPDFTKGVYINSMMVFWKLETMKFLFKLPEEVRKLLRNTI